MLRISPRRITVIALLACSVPTTALAGGRSRKVKMNFSGDWGQIVNRELRSMGKTPRSSRDLMSRTTEYYRWLRRIVPTRARKVHIAPSVKANGKAKTGLMSLIRKAKEGKSLREHQSTAVVLDDQFQDALLSDWGIHHFHLGTKRYGEDSSFVSRTKQVAFAKVERDDFYLIGVAEHGGRKEPWHDPGLIQVLHENWPHLLDPFRVLGEFWKKSNKVEAGAEGVRRRRQSGDLYGIKVKDGTTYDQPGGGFLAADDPFAGMQAMVILERIKEYSASIEEFPHIRGRADLERLELDMEDGGFITRGFDVGGKQVLRMPLDKDRSVDDAQALRRDFILNFARYFERIRDAEIKTMRDLLTAAEQSLPQIFRGETSIFQDFFEAMEAADVDFALDTPLENWKISDGRENSL